MAGLGVVLDGWNDRMGDGQTCDEEDILGTIENQAPKIQQALIPPLFPQTNCSKNGENDPKRRDEEFFCCPCKCRNFKVHQGRSFTTTRDSSTANQCLMKIKYPKKEG
jgi:hypothetical protein